MDIESVYSAPGIKNPRMLKVLITFHTLLSDSFRSQTSLSVSQKHSFFICYSLWDFFRWWLMLWPLFSEYNFQLDSLSWGLHAQSLPQTDSSVVFCGCVCVRVQLRNIFFFLKKWQFSPKKNNEQQDQMHEAFLWKTNNDKGQWQINTNMYCHSGRIIIIENSFKLRFHFRFLLIFLIFWSHLRHHILLSAHTSKFSNNSSPWHRRHVCCRCVVFLFLLVLNSIICSLFVIHRLMCESSFAFTEFPLSLSQRTQQQSRNTCFIHTHTQTLEQTDFITVNIIVQILEGRERN